MPSGAARFDPWVDGDVSTVWPEIDFGVVPSELCGVGSLSSAGKGQGQGRTGARVAVSWLEPGGALADGAAGWFELELGQRV